MRVVVVNSGSSSIKYKVFALEDLTTLMEGLLERIGPGEARLKHRRLTVSDDYEEIIETRFITNHREGLEFILDVAGRYPTTRDAPREFFGFGHRVVHGGEVFRKPVIIDDEAIRQIEDLIPLAPLHNPPNLVAIRALRELRPDVPNVAVFDTAFHQSMPPKAFHYALPSEFYRMHHVRRYGFHGSSHQYVAKEASRYLGIPEEQLNLITLHLGNGASASALHGGKSIDTSMGLTPLEGLIMGTRCGDLDPAVHFYLSRKTGKSFEAIEDILNKESGLKGICGMNDMREIQRCAEDGDDQAELAIEMFCYRIKKYIGSYYAVLGRVDAIIFTGGIGENSARVRKESCEGLTALGISLDDHRNEEASFGVLEIQSEESRVKMLVIPTDEEREIALQTIHTIRHAAGVKGVPNL
ncbi:MAG: acetate kinase [Thermodesulfobacteriota bacterium]|nr:acetate kinase [Thermodesulfobacteriota bacterium]